MCLCNKRTFFTQPVLWKSSYSLGINMFWSDAFSHHNFSAALSVLVSTGSTGDVKSVLQLQFLTVPGLRLFCWSGRKWLWNGSHISGLGEMGRGQMSLMTIPHAEEEIFQIPCIHSCVEQRGLHACQVHFGLHSVQTVQNRKRLSWTEFCHGARYILNAVH